MIRIPLVSFSKISIAPNRLLSRSIAHTTVRQLKFMSPSPSPPPAKRARSKSPKRENGGPAASVETGALATFPKPNLPDPNSNRSQKKTQKEQSRRVRHKRRDYEKACSKTGRDPIEFDIEDMIGIKLVTDILSEGKEFEDKFERDQQLELVIERLNSHGDGLAKAPTNDWVLAVPGALPGEKVVAQVQSNERMWTRTKLVQILEKNSTLRRDDLVGCKYFGTCGGCQYQMLTYDEQLRIKQGVVERAFKRHSGLDSSLLPAVLPTMPSPKQYNYRTKLTPHFDLPHELRRPRHGKAGRELKFEALPDKFEFPIGFDSSGTKRVMDIEVS